MASMQEVIPFKQFTRVLESTSNAVSQAVLSLG